MKIIVFLLLTSCFFLAVPPGWSQDNRSETAADEPPDFTEESSPLPAGETETDADFTLDLSTLDPELAEMLDDPFALAETETADEDILSIIDDPFKTDAEDTATQSGAQQKTTGSAGSDEEIIDLADLDTMFQDDMFEEIDETTQNTAPQQEFLKEEGVRWGGKIRGAADSSWDWNLQDPENNSFSEPADISLAPTVAADLYFSARPETDFRVYGKLKIQSGTESAGFSDLLGFTITQDASGNIIFGFGGGGGDTTQTPDDESVDEDPPASTEQTDPDFDTNETPADYDNNDDDAGLPQYPLAKEEEPDEEEDPAETGAPLTLSVSVFELFADFSWQDLLFFRFGKHTIKWGVGYFWSPSDVLNLTPIDTEDPTAEREGPISLKTNFPFGIHNAYLYLIANQVARPLDVAIAPKVEFVLGNSEFGVGAFYQRELAPRLVGTVKTTIRDFDLFGECVLSYGSDRVFVHKSRDQSAADESFSDDLEIVLETREDKSSLFLNATAGFMYSYADWNMTLLGQYLFNGEGYQNSELLEAAYYLSQNSDTNGLFIADEADRPDDYEDPPELGTADLMNFGRHYAALSVSFSEVFGNEDLSFSLFVLTNLCDLSGIISPSLGFKLFNRINLTLGLRTTFGDAGDEYTNPAALAAALFGGGTEAEPPYKGPTLTLSFNMSIGSGSF